QQALVPLMKESARLYPDLIQRDTQYTDLPTGYRTEGTVLIGADRADAQHLAELIDYIKDEDLNIQPLTTRQARQLEPALSPRIAKAAAIDCGHQLDPRLFARALFDAILARGAQHVLDTVSTITQSAMHQSATLSSGARIEVESSDIMVLAAGLGA